MSRIGFRERWADCANIFILLALPLAAFGQTLGSQKIQSFPMPDDWQAYSFQVRADSRVIASGEVATYEEASAAIQEVIGAEPRYRLAATRTSSDGQWQVHEFLPDGRVSPIASESNWTWRAVSEDQPGRPSALEAMEHWIADEVAQGRICHPPRNNPEYRPQIVGEPREPDGSPVSPGSAVAVQEVKACYRELLGTACRDDQISCMTATAVGERPLACPGDFFVPSIDPEGKGSCVDTRTALVGFSNDTEKLTKVASGGADAGCKQQQRLTIKPPSERELGELKTLPTRGKVRLAVRFSPDLPVSDVIVLQGSGLDRVDEHVVNYLCGLNRKAVASILEDFPVPDPGSWRRVDWYPLQELLKW